MIGTTARYVDIKDAQKHIAGYCIVNDVSEREYQIERGGQWTKGKSCDTFCPMGPWVVTADEIADAGKLQVRTDVNGERRQDSNTADLIFGIDHIVSYCSQFMTLNPGDVIPTGTPSGVAMGFKPPKFLKAGDTMRLTIEGLGEQTSAWWPTGAEADRPASGTAAGGEGLRVTLSVRGKANLPQGHGGLSLWEKSGTRADRRCQR